MSPSTSGLLKLLQKRLLQSGGTWESFVSSKTRPLHTVEGVKTKENYEQRMEPQQDARNSTLRLVATGRSVCSVPCARSASENDLREHDVTTSEVVQFVEAEEIAGSKKIAVNGILTTITAEKCQGVS